MGTEQALAEFVLTTDYQDLPGDTLAVAKNLILTVIGTTVAGAKSEGCEALLECVRGWGGREEATILVHGGKVPAHKAAFVNSVMARSLDFCDALTNGLHLGSSVVPTALAAAEMARGCSGKQFLSAIAVGTEVAARLNLVSTYNGFDPTGICAPLGAAATAAKILGLDSRQLINSLALAFNRAGGSYQSNVDASLAVRVIQGFASETAIASTEFAQAGISGPKNFLDGRYGYLHFFAKDNDARYTLTRDLGVRFEMANILFKKYPSCGGTLGATEGVLDLVEKHGIREQDVTRIDVTIPPLSYTLVGHPFEIGHNPKVSAQFNVRYCVANALIRSGSRLRHFDELEIRNPQVLDLAKKVYVSPKDNPGATFSAAGTTIKIHLRSGEVLEKEVGIPKGGPGNPLTRDENLDRFRDCIDYASRYFPSARGGQIIDTIDRLHDVENVLELLPLLSTGRVSRPQSTAASGGVARAS